MSLFNILQKIARYPFQIVEAGFSRTFGPNWNPFYQLGALSFFFYWIIAVSGLYLYAFFETSTSAAFASVEYLTHDQWYLGGIMRSLHRYASDAFVITITLHLIREFSRGHYRGTRWFSWFTGIPLLWLAFAAGIGGYWLVWDKLAQYIAVSTAEWLDWLPFFSESMARNFLNQENLSDRFFSLLSFLHVAIPLFLLLGMWIHTQRISCARTNPVRGLAIGTLIALIVLSLLKPALSQGGIANLDVVAASVNLDWFYLNVYPLLDKWSPGEVWILLVGISFLLIIMPWLPRGHSESVAVVDLDNCNGCGRCFDDCPYSAVVMKPRTDGLAYSQEAVVDPNLCVSCGICVGACPTSTPFRRATALVPGIDMPQLTIKKIRERTINATKTLSGKDRVMVYGCRHGVDFGKLQDKGVAVMTLPCIAALPPSFIDFIILRNHADGVLLTGCLQGDCYHRLGIDWTEQRLAGQRDPYLRKKVPRERITTCWTGSNLKNLGLELENFRGHLRELPRLQQSRSTPDSAQAIIKEGG